eukprot:TRINITY_DN13489_c0_g1_i1.p1 TRINITY_DN13489_c0_g1~~TRINITY_DN13489_c0_g1_i1.p1  ORF type:complete len:450 (-),score=125.35 TRINITY_DN13489_c0_g1_i1:96-1355(-)
MAAVLSNQYPPQQILAFLDRKGADFDEHFVAMIQKLEFPLSPNDKARETMLKLETLKQLLQYVPALSIPYDTKKKICLIIVEELRRFAATASPAQVNQPDLETPTILQQIIDSEKKMRLQKNLPDSLDNFLSTYPEEILVEFAADQENVIQRWHKCLAAVEKQDGNQATMFPILFSLASAYANLPYARSPPLPSKDNNFLVGIGHADAILKLYPAGDTSERGPMARSYAYRLRAQLLSNLVKGLKANETNPNQDLISMFIEEAIGSARESLACGPGLDQGGDFQVKIATLTGMLECHSTLKNLYSTRVQGDKADNKRISDIYQKAMTLIDSIQVEDLQSDKASKVLGEINELLEDAGRPTPTADIWKQIDAIFNPSQNEEAEQAVDDDTEEAVDNDDANADADAGADAGADADATNAAE